MTLLFKNILYPSLALSFFIFSSENVSAEVSEVFQCEGKMEYQYEHIGAAYNELWSRDVPVNFKFAKFENRIKFIDGWPILKGKEMILAPTYGGNIHGLILDKDSGQDGQLSMVQSFWMFFTGTYTFARNGWSGVATSIGKCRALG